MKKLVALLVVGAVAMSASADLTGWKNTGGKLFDNTGAAVTTPAGVLAWSVAGDLNSQIVGGTIDISALSGALSATLFGFVPVGPAAGNYSAEFASDGSAVGTRTDIFQVGNYIGIIAVNTITDLQPDPAAPAGTPTQFTTGNVTTDVQVIPEPATLGLMGIAGLGMFLARKKARR